MNVETVRVVADNKHGFVIINVCDIKPDHEPYSDEDRAMFPVAAESNQKLSEVHAKNVKALASKIADLEGQLSGVTKDRDVLKEANEKLSLALEEADEEIARLVGLNEKLSNTLKEIDKAADSVAEAKSTSSKPSTVKSKGKG